MKQLLNHMEEKIEEVFYQEEEKNNKGNCVGIDAETTFNFYNKEYYVEMEFFWETLYWYNYILKNENEIISKGMIRI